MCAACAAQNTVAPDSMPSSLKSTVGMYHDITFSGTVNEVYQWSDRGEPSIADALIEVTDTTGSKSTRSDAEGRYSLTVSNHGDATITVSKEGYESGTWPVPAAHLRSTNVIWLFSLRPI